MIETELIAVFFVFYLLLSESLNLFLHLLHCLIFTLLYDNSPSKSFLPGGDMFHWTFCTVTRKRTKYDNEISIYLFLEYIFFNFLFKIKEFTFKKQNPSNI